MEVVLNVSFPHDVSHLKKVVCTGSCTELGNWKPENAPTGPIVSGANGKPSSCAIHIKLNEKKSFEFKLVEMNGSTVWESFDGDKNRHFDYNPVTMGKASRVEVVGLVFSQYDTGTVHIPSSESGKAPLPPTAAPVATIAAATVPVIKADVSGQNGHIHVQLSESSASQKKAVQPSPSAPSAPLREELPILVNLSPSSDGKHIRVDLHPSSGANGVPIARAGEETVPSPKKKKGFGYQMKKLKTRFMGLFKSS